MHECHSICTSASRTSYTSKQVMSRTCVVRYSALSWGIAFSRMLPRNIKYAVTSNYCMTSWRTPLDIHVYSYFEKGCRKKCMRQSRKVLWVVLSLLFFKEIWKNGTRGPARGHGRMFAHAKGSRKRNFDSYSVWNSVLIISHITFRDRRVHIFADNLSRNSCTSKDERCAFAARWHLRAVHAMSALCVRRDYKHTSPGVFRGTKI